MSLRPELGFLKEFIIAGLKLRAGAKTLPIVVEQSALNRQQEVWPAKGGRCQ